jgi:hypothetical protein
MLPRRQQDAGRLPPPERTSRGTRPRASEDFAGAVVRRKRRNLKPAPITEPPGRRSAHANTAPRAFAGTWSGTQCTGGIEGSRPRNPASVSAPAFPRVRTLWPRVRLRPERLNGRLSYAMRPRWSVAGSGGGPAGHGWRRARRAPRQPGDTVFPRLGVREPRAVEGRERIVDGCLRPSFRSPPSQRHST